MIAFMLFKDPFAGAKAPHACGTQPQTKLRYLSILPLELYVATRQRQFFSRSTQIIARMVQFYCPTAGRPIRRKSQNMAVWATDAEGPKNKKDGARNANPVFKEIWRESLIT
jgi:hypothetical protein